MYFKTYVRTVSVRRYLCNEIIYYGSTYALELEFKKKNWFLNSMGSHNVRTH